MALFGIRVFVDVAKMMSYWVKMGTNPMTSVLIKSKQQHKDMYRGKMAM